MRLSLNIKHEHDKLHSTTIEQYKEIEGPTVGLISSARIEILLNSCNDSNFLGKVGDITSFKYLKIIL